MKITEKRAEVVGIYLGDGYIYTKDNKWQIGFVGNPKTDLTLFENLKKIIKDEWNKEVNFKIRTKGLRMVFRSKEIKEFLIDYLKLPFGEGKCEKIFIPNQIIGNWDLVKYVIRGLADTDGTIFVSKKKGVENYPAIEITTTSKILAEQLKEILSEKSFHVANIHKSKSKTSKRVAYRIALYGRENVKKWVNEIGFSNKYKLERAKSYIQ